MNPKRIHRSMAALLLCAVLPSPARSAAEDAEEAVDPPATTLRDTIVVSANRVATEIDDVGSSVTVLDAEQIELRAKTTVAELLRSVPGVEVVRGGGPGQVTSVFIRGGNSSHTLVLLDGVRVNDPSTGAFDFANLSTDAVERIEIVRGPQSTLYGSEAMAGVISITSKRGREGLHVSGLAEAGELDHRRWRLRVDGGSERFDYSLTASDESTDGVSAARESAGNTEDDAYDLTSVTAGLGFALGGDGRADLTLRTFDGRVGNDGFDFTAGPVDDLDRLQDREGLVASLRVRKQLGRRWNQTFVLGFHDDELSGTDPDDLFSNFTVDSRSAELTAQSDVTLSESDVLSFGATYDDRGSDSVGNFDENVDIVSFFVQNAWASSADRFHLTAGVRYDDHSRFGDETTFRSSISWDVTSSTRLHGSYGTGFKAPTLNDLFFPFFSNLDLRPETSEGFDLGVEQSFLDDKVTVGLTWFSTDFEDLIAFDFATFLPQNIASGSSDGVELTLAVRPNARLQVSLSYTYNDTEDGATGLQLARRPEHRSTLDVFFRPGDRFRGALGLIVGRDRIDSDGSDMDDYERVDLTLHYRASRALEPYLRVENLFGEDYEEINGFTTPGAVAVVGLGFRY